MPLAIDRCLEFRLNGTTLKGLMEVPMLWLQMSQHCEQPLFISVCANEMPVKFIELISEFLVSEVVLNCKNEGLTSLLQVRCVHPLNRVYLRLFGRVDCTFIDLRKVDSRAYRRIDGRKEVVKSSQEVILAGLRVYFALKVFLLKFYRRLLEACIS